MAEYKIERAVPMLDIDIMGRFVKKYRVYYKVDDIEDWVDVLEEEFTVENVRKKIEERIKTMKELLGKK